MRYSLLLLPVAAFLLASCDGGSTGPVDPPTLDLSAHDLTLQVAQEQTLTATFRDPRGSASPVIVWQSTDAGVASVTNTGTVRGVAPGTAKIIASERGVADTATVVVLSPIATSCGTTGLTLAPGEIRSFAPAEAAAICLHGGTGSEFTVVLTDTGSASSVVKIAAAGMTAPIGPPSPALLPAPGALRTRGLAPRSDFGFEARLRERGRRLMDARMASAPARMARRSILPGAPRYAVQVGDSLTLNVDTANNCTSPAQKRRATVMAVGTRAIIAVDNANPAGGLTAAQYQQVAATFDNQIWPSDTENFGEPVDIDQNGKVILFYTRSVNELTPESSKAQGYVGGYFFPGDVFPRSECPTSNEAEMFYLLSPDPNGEIHNNTFTADEVIGQTEGTVAHEFQHLINAERRIYVNHAQVGEEVWLDEGLAHIAEELLFYRVSGLGPRQNIDLSKLRSTSAILNAVNSFQVANLGRLSSYLGDPENNGPFQDDDDLETRGSIWQFLRYAADRKNGTDRDLWYALVNSTTSGKANLRAALGVDPGVWLADFTTAQYTDDAVGSVEARFTFPSWNFRSVLPAINRNTHPLQPRVLTDGRTLSVRLADNGGTAYLRAGVTAGVVGSIQLTTGAGTPLPGSVRVTVIRTK